MLLRTLHSKFADAAFSLAGLELAEARSFSFLSGKRSAVYGVNLPCDQVILALDASTTSSETLAQSRGRRCGDPPPLPPPAPAARLWKNRNNIRAGSYKNEWSRTAGPRIVY